LRRKLSDVGEDRCAGGRDLVHGIGELESEIVEEARRGRPGVAGDDGAAGEGVVGGLVGGGSSPPGEAGALLIFLRVTGEKGLRSADLMIQARQIQIRVAGARKRAFE